MKGGEIPPGGGRGGDLPDEREKGGVIIFRGSRRGVG